MLTNLSKRLTNKDTCIGAGMGKNAHTLQIITGHMCDNCFFNSLKIMKIHRENKCASIVTTHHCQASGHSV